MVNPFGASLLITLRLMTSVEAKDFGVQGTIYPILEEDPISLIQDKLNAMEKSGELKQHNKELQEKTKVSVEKPKPVEGITKATEARVFYYDPTYIVAQDILDYAGKLIVQKGTKVNSLKTVSLPYSLLFFDGDDPEQKNWAKEQVEQACVFDSKANDFNNSCQKLKLILLKGTPLSLSEEWKVPVYFDQGGVLTQKLGIKHIPAVLTQEDLRLKIEEIDVQSYKEDCTRKGSNATSDAPIRQENR